MDNTEPNHVDVDDVICAVSCGGSHTVALAGEYIVYSLHVFFE